MGSHAKSGYRIGILVLIGLAVLTLVEFFVALMGGMVIPLLLIAVFKAALILEYFMHLSHLWAGGEE